MLPTALAYIVIIAAAVLVLESAGIRQGAMYSAILGALNMVLVVIMFTFLDRGRIVSPAYGRATQAQLEDLREASRRSKLATGAAS
jgi:NADH-quinone oxidoreductase subunit H